MKKGFLFTLFFCCSTLSLFAQFGPEQVLTLNIEEPRQLKSFDMDGDGDLDLLCGTSDAVDVTWYENDGLGNFSDPHFIGTTSGLVSMHADDLDGDDDMDVLVAMKDYNRVIWYENLGDEVFAESVIITNWVIDVTSVYTSDLDNDGDQDVLCTSEADDEVIWFQNDGTGDFSSEIFISLEAEGASDVTTADLDGDGDLDVISTSSIDHKVAWYENDGTGVFGAQQIVSDTAYGARMVYAFDLDGDDDLDLLAACHHYALGTKSTWYENDGDGNFGPELLITDEVPGVRDIFAADLDGDLDLDVMVADPTGDRLIWFANDGTGDFGDFTVITSDVDFPSSIFSADLDGDGDQDIFIPDQNRNELDWFSNDGLGNFSDKIIIITSVYGVSDVQTGDLDGDGDLEIVSTDYLHHKIVVYMNNGDGDFSERKVWDYDAESARNFVLSDLDGDDDLDLLLSQGIDNIVAWYENDGDANFVEKHIITDVIDYAAGVCASDLDGDGDNDVLCGAKDGDNIGWYENDGEGNFGPLQYINDDLNGPRLIITADIDGDGDQDVVSGSAAGFDWYLAWYENDGTGSFGEMEVISTSNDGITSISAADFDLDGDLDILCANNTDPAFTDEVKWYRNNGVGDFGTFFYVTFLVDQPTEAVPADVDGDGDMDVIVGSNGDDEHRLGWFENDGTGEFGPQNPIGGEDILYLTDVAVGDLDGDYGVDVVTGVYIDHVSWYENLECAAPLTITMVDEEDKYICIDADEVSLDANLEGGTFSGTAVSGTGFDPGEAGPGIHYIIYEVELEDGCFYMDSIPVVVEDLEEIEFFLDEDVYCLSPYPVVLDADPWGGEFSGPGVSGDEFTAADAGPGTHFIHYTYTSYRGCVSIDSMEITIIDEELPDVEFEALEDETVCLGIGAFAVAGSPGGGTFDGPGIIGDEFNPTTAGIGTHTLYYTFENDEGCSATDSVEINVVDCLGTFDNSIPSIAVYPNPFDEFTTVYIDQNLTGTYRIYVTDILGKTVYTAENLTGSQFEISKDQLGSGVFFLTVRSVNEQTTATVRIVAQ